MKVVKISKRLYNEIKFYNNCLNDNYFMSMFDKVSKYELLKMINYRNEHINRKFIVILNRE